ncbi:MAG TPA: hypothetical protein VGD41_17595, partial [Pyrinomonadaceae bacterium]
KLVGLPLAGSGGRQVFVNPDQVVCLMDVGGSRTQIVTTGLSTESSITLTVERSLLKVVEALLEA